MSQIQEVKQAVDIIEVIGERVELKRSGTNFRGLCPFHSEKSPSFFVSDVLQRYKCFGCGESGDAFTFLEKYDGMSFGEALKTLADRAHITLKEFSPTPEDDEREKLLEILNLTKEYYHYLLTEHEVGQAAREYLKERGITKDSIKLFQLGYALPKWDGLLKYLHLKKKYSLELLERAGLILESKGRRYDRFRHRLMFPLKNHRGQVVGFSGRVLEKDVKEAKYINSPETSLYHKSQLLFGFHELFAQIREKREVIVVEGEFDVVSSAQAHVNHVVAVKGSALTTEQVRLLERVVDKVLLSLDTDAAGVKATKRAIEVLKDSRLELRVLTLPDGKDPDDLARKDPKAWREATKSSISSYEFLLRMTLAAHDQETPEGKREIIKEMGPILLGIEHAVERDFYIKKVAQALQVKESVVREDLQKIGSKVTQKSGKSKAAQAQEPQPLTRRQTLERYLFFLWLRDENLFTDQKSQIKQHQWQLPGLTKTAQRLAELDTVTKLNTVIPTLAEDQQQLVSDIYLDTELMNILEEAEPSEEWQQTWQALQQQVTKDRVTAITTELDALDAKEERTPEEEARQHELLQEIVLLKRKK